jgi:hypothetical protein
MHPLFLSFLNIGKRLLLLHGRSSLRITNTFSLEIVSIKLDNTKINIDDSIFLYLKPEMPLISIEEPLPPRGDMRGYFALNRRVISVSSINLYCFFCARVGYAFSEKCFR